MLSPGPSRKGEGVNAPILSKQRGLERKNLLTYIRINTVDVRRHHELHVKALVALWSIICPHLVLVRLIQGVVVAIT